MALNPNPSELVDFFLLAEPQTPETKSQIPGLLFPSVAVWSQRERRQAIDEQQ
jgi:hypothetical protein